MIPMAEPLTEEDVKLLLNSAVSQAALGRLGADRVLEGVERIVAEWRALRAKRDSLLAAIRKHRDYRGDDRCYLDDGELYAILPEGDTRPWREVAVTLDNCRKFIICRQQGREYVSPQRRIEELEAELSRQKEENVKLAERCREQSELLSRISERTQSDGWLATREEQRRAEVSLPPVDVPEDADS